MRTAISIIIALLIVSLLASCRTQTLSESKSETIVNRLSVTDTTRVVETLSTRDTIIDSVRYILKDRIVRHEYYNSIVQLDTIIKSDTIYIANKDSEHRVKNIDYAIIIIFFVGLFLVLFKLYF